MADGVNGKTGNTVALPAVKVNTLDLGDATIHSRCSTAKIVTDAAESPGCVSSGNAQVRDLISQRQSSLSVQWL